MTNQQVFDEGEILQHCPVDINPFTGMMESNGGIEHLVSFEGKVYSILTDWEGLVADPTGTPDLISDNVDEFTVEISSIENREEADLAFAKQQEQIDEDELGMLYYSEQSNFDMRHDDL